MKEVGIRYLITFMGEDFFPQEFFKKINKNKGPESRMNRGLFFSFFFLFFLSYSHGEEGIFFPENFLLPGNLMVHLLWSRVSGFFP